MVKYLPPFIIAEIGNNHEGNFENAMKMVKAAADAKVDAVKFQTMNPNLFISSKDEKRINQLMKFRLKNEEFSVSHNALNRDIFGLGITLASHIMDKKPGIYSMTELMEDL